MNAKIETVPTALRAWPMTQTPLAGAVGRHPRSGHWMIDSMPALCFAVTADGHITQCNQPSVFDQGCDAGDDVLPALLTCVTSDHHKRVATMLREVFASGSANCDADLVLGRGTPVAHYLVGRRVQHDGLTYASIVAIDITARLQSERKHDYLALHDALTGLPNRAMLHESLACASRVAKREKRSMAVLFLDLDNFKPINDRAGHAVGDAVLRTVARRLVRAVRESDSVFRYGGDEFVVLLRSVSDEQGAAAVAQKIAAALSSPIRHRKASYQVGVSIGIAMYPTLATGVSDLISIADAAMYKAKRGGKGRVEFGGVLGSACNAAHCGNTSNPLVKRPASGCVHLAQSHFNQIHEYAH